MLDKNNARIHSFSDDSISFLGGKRDNVSAVNCRCVQFYVSILGHINMSYAIMHRRFVDVIPLCICFVLPPVLFV